MEDLFIELTKEDIVDIEEFTKNELIEFLLSTTTERITLFILQAIFDTTEKINEEMDSIGPLH